MSKVRVAFEVLEDGKDPPPTFQEMRCHLIFDVKMEDFQRKARLVAGGHMTTPPSATVTYASVVSRESVRIALTLAALNDLEVKPPTSRMRTSLRQLARKFGAVWDQSSDRTQENEPLLSEPYMALNLQVPRSGTTSMIV